MPDGRSIRAVLFDMDGVLVDSMPNHCRAWVEAFRLRGHEIDPVLPRLREGEKAHDTWRWLPRSAAFFAAISRRSSFLVWTSYWMSCVRAVSNLGW